MRVRKRSDEDFIADVQPPDTAVMYYGLEPKRESGWREFPFFFSVYGDGVRAISDVLDSGKRADYTFKAPSRHALPMAMQNSGFLTSKDFGVINPRRNKSTRTLIGFVAEPVYGVSRRDWDYAEAYLGVDNKIQLVWRH